MRRSLAPDGPDGPDPVPPFARFECVILFEESQRYRAHGVTLDDVIADQRERFGRSLALAGGHRLAPGQFAGRGPDHVIYDEGTLRVVAVLRPRADGRLDRLGLVEVEQEREGVADAD